MKSICDYWVHGGPWIDPVIVTHLMIDGGAAAF
jgi:hypothetical protein